MTLSERLRYGANCPVSQPSDDIAQEMREAADEIDRLTVEVAKMRDQIGTLHICKQHLEAECREKGRSIAALREERDALKARWAQFEEYDCDELKAAYALLDQVKQERDALAATVEFLRGTLVRVHNGGATWSGQTLCREAIESVKHPSAILAALKASIRAQALRDAKKRCEYINSSAGTNLYHAIAELDRMAEEAEKEANHG